MNIVLLLCFWFSSAFALDVPQTDLTLKRPQAVASSPRETRISMEVSSWIPRGLLRPSLLSDVTDYDTNGIPQLSLNFSSYFLNYGRFQLLPKAGISYLYLMRTGASPYFGRNFKLDEEMHLLSLRVGADFSLQSPWLGWFKPLIGFSLLPTMEWIPKTFSGDSETRLGILGEYNLGLDIVFQWISDNFDIYYSALYFCALGTLGKIDTYNYTALGLSAGIKIGF